MYSGKVCEGSSGDDGVVFPCGGRHQLDDHCDGSKRTTNCNRNEDATMPPMKVMALVQNRESLCVNGAAGVKDPVKNVDGPGSSGDKECNPQFEMKMGRARDGEGPHNRYRRRIEARKVPEGKDLGCKAAQFSGNRKSRSVSRL
jgi:hypothetical protein